jgi:RNA polymerase sigma factor (sigma-70 family)
LESFEQLAEQYKPMIHKIINSLHIYRNQDEFYQNGLIALWEASNRYDQSKGNFTNYAYTFIKGTLLKQLEKEFKDQQRNICPSEEFWEYTGEFHSDHPLEAEMLQTYCEALTPNQQNWVFYTVIDDLSIKEIAEREKVSVSAVKLWRSGAKKKVRELVSE